MKFQAKLTSSGQLTARLIRPMSPGVWWKVRNTTRPAFVWGLIANLAARLFGRVTGLPVIRTKLSARLFRADGKVIDYGVLSRRVVTTAFVNFLVDQMQAETSEWGDFKFHDSGVGTTAAVIGDTDIETTDAESRATGSQTEGASANIYKSVGTIAYSSTKAITEHGLFSQVTGTTLLDRSVFSAINVVDGDSIEFTFEYTADAGG